MSGRVERVRTTSPHAHVIVVSRTPDEYPPSRSPPPARRQRYQYGTKKAKSAGTWPLRARALRAPPPKGGEGRPPPTWLPQAVHGGQEFFVRLGELELVEQELHGLHGVELGERLAKEPDLL